MKKLFLIPFFGSPPPWYPQYIDHVRHLQSHGYDLLIDTDLAKFQERVRSKLHIDCPIIPGTGKLWDYRATLGYLYEEETAGYDFWGHTDLDCVYGNVGKWVTDEFLGNLDIHSNHGTYICGPWTLYRNVARVNQLFMEQDDWQGYLERPEVNAWVEAAYSRLVERSGLRFQYTYWQNLNPSDDSGIAFRDGKLYDHGQEIMMYHFRRTKRWPLRG